MELIYTFQPNPGDDDQEAARLNVLITVEGPIESDSVDYLFAWVVSKVQDHNHRISRRLTLFKNWKFVVVELLETALAYPEANLPEYQDYRQSLQAELASLKASIPAGELEAFQEHKIMCNSPALIAAFDRLFELGAKLNRRNEDNPHAQ